MTSWRGLALAAVAVASTGIVHAHMETSARLEVGEAFVPRPDRVRVSALGFDALVGDYYWLKAVQVVGGLSGSIEAHAELIADLVDVATRVDPWLDHPYRFAAVWLTDSADSVRRANQLMERGIAYHPRDWRNRYHLGFNHFFYLEDSRRAAEVMEPAVTLEGAPRYLGALVARLRADTGSLESAVAFLAELAESAGHGYERAEYLKALDEIETERAARFLDDARAEFWERHGRDIERVEDLLAGPEPVLRALPLAQTQLEGFHWVLDEESGQIVSSFYGIRYGLHEHPLDRERRERWREAARVRAAAKGEGA